MVTLGALAVALSASGGVFTGLIETLRDWLGRQSARYRISVTIDGDTIELERASTGQQQALVDAYVERPQAVELAPAVQAAMTTVEPSRSSGRAIGRVLAAPFTVRTWAEQLYVLVNLPLGVVGLVYTLATLRRGSANRLSTLHRDLASRLLGETVASGRGDIDAQRAHRYLLLQACWLDRTTPAESGSPLDPGGCAGNVARRKHRRIPR